MPSPRLIAAIVFPLLGTAGVVSADPPPVRKPAAPRAPRTLRIPRLLFTPAQSGIVLRRPPDVLEAYPMVVARADPGAVSHRDRPRERRLLSDPGDPACRPAGSQGARPAGPDRSASGGNPAGVAVTRQDLQLTGSASAPSTRRSGAAGRGGGRGAAAGEAVVCLAGVAHELDLPSEALEGGEELLGLLDGAAQVPLAVEDQQRRAHPRGVAQRRLRQHPARLVPRVAAEIVALAEVEVAGAAMLCRFTTLRWVTAQRNRSVWPMIQLVM